MCLKACSHVCAKCSLISRSDCADSRFPMTLQHAHKDALCLLLSMYVTVYICVCVTGDWRMRCCTWDQLWAWHLEHLFTVYTGDDFAWIVSKKQKPKHRASVLFVFVFVRSIHQHIVWILVQNNDFELLPKRYLLLLLTAHCSQNLLAPSQSQWLVCRVQVTH